MPLPGEPLIIEHVRIPAAELEFSYARSSAPGGQNVNKVNSKAVLHFDARHSPSLPEDVRRRFLSRFRSLLTTEGVVVIMADEHRDQPRNAAACVDKLTAMVAAVLHPPKARRATRPTRGAVQRRLADKTAHGRKKEQRGGKGWD